MIIMGRDRKLTLIADTRNAVPVGDPLDLIGFFPNGYESLARKYAAQQGLVVGQDVTAYGVVIIPKFTQRMQLYK